MGNEIMRKTSQLSNLYKRIRVTLLILFVYILGSSIPLPYAHTSHQFTRLLHDTPMGITSFMSGANMQQLSLFMVGLNPMMIAMLLMQLLMMIRLFHFDTLSMSQIMYVQQGLILVLAVIQSAAMTVGLHLTDNPWTTASVIIILTTGSMFVTWLGFMNMQFGIGGTVAIILFNIITSSIPTVLGALRSINKLSHPTLILIAIVIFNILLMIFWLAFTKAYYPLKAVNILLDSHSKLVTTPLGLNMGAMMTYMVGMALLMMPLIFSSILGPHSLLARPGFDALISGIMSFFLYYFFSFVQFSPYQQSRSFRNSNTYIPGLHPGKPTQKYLTRLMWIVCFPGALLNSIQLTFGLMGQYFLGKYGGLSVIPMNVVMIVLIMNGVKDNLFTLTFPRKYERFSQRGDK
ncbi:accessory Sec system protein translocase subunit SecY2 [Limosilactobacillus sp.]|uniref:accessory Sec system protein translocase subunit SecY2 n=1 Tax=Limosilactobacillus sp. TaxID=2773925 RepID=UPI00345EEA9D